MQFTRQRHRPNQDDRILPLTNIVFLLLIFFMLTGQLSNPDTLAIRPPQSISETPAQSTGMLVQVNSKGTLALDGTPVGPKALESMVSEHLQEHPNTLVRLKADGLTDASRVVSVMSILRSAGVEHLRLMTTAEAEQ